MSRRGENIFKRKDGRWEARYAVSEHGVTRYRSVYGRSYLQAKKKRQALRSSNESEKLGTGKFRNVAAIWLESVRLTVKESTFSRYYRTVYTYLVAYFGEAELAEMNGEAIDLFAGYLLKNGSAKGGALSPKTVCDILYVLKSVIGFAAERGYEVTNEKIRYPQTVKRDFTVLTSANRQKLEEALSADSDGASLGILIALFTGMRIGEVCGLTWADVNSETAVIEVRRTVERISAYGEGGAAKTKIVISAPKTQNSVRAIPVPEFVNEKLRARRGGEAEYIVTGSDRVMEPHTFYMRYKTFLKKHGIEDCSFHSLRHSFATRCIELGVDAKTLSAILGHSNVSTTLAVYVHPTLEQKRRQINKLLSDTALHSGEP